MEPTPALFVPHGSPMFALQPGAAGAALAALARELVKPRALVVVSPHWETVLPTVGTATSLETLHDFGGFDPRLYDIRYPATGCPEAAHEVVEALQQAGITAATDASRGLDHGAWVPLRHMYPEADVPIVPLSIQHHRGPSHAYEVGRALEPLAARGVMVVGSGNITHNLHDWQIALRTGQSQFDYVRRFTDWVKMQVEGRHINELLNYRLTQPSGSRAHPRDEHLLPLFTALGAAGTDVDAKAFYCGISDYVLAMDGYVMRRRLHT